MAVAFEARGHDHATCKSTALARAAAICARRGARLTALRRRVLELVWDGHEPAGAYEILAALSRVRPAAPPTVYRALEFLLAHGLVHRIESLNAYVGCDHPDAPHRGQFLICERCRRSAEIDDTGIGQAVAATAKRAGFEVGALTVEIAGVCGECRADGQERA